MDNDSYPPSADWKNNNARDISSLNGDDVSEGESLGSESTNEEESDEGRGRVTSGSIEGELPDTDTSEEYVEPTTGIKVKYSPTLGEIKDFVRRSRKYENKLKVQRKHTVIQSILFVLLVVLACLGGSIYYMIMAALPLLALLIMWAIPFLNIRASAQELIKEDEFTIEVFPDRLEVESKSGRKTLALDDTCKSEEYNNSIMIFNQGGSGLIIPLRAVEPELRAEVQAIIAAGSNPLSKEYENGN